MVITVDVLQPYWDRVWSGLELAAPAHLFLKLVNAYQEPHRKYHTLQHIHECLVLLQTVKDQASAPFEIELALWFHDAVYAFDHPHSEKLSAEWLKKEVLEAGGSDVLAERLYQLILATEHKANPTDPDQQLLVDIDLAVLAANKERFTQYQRQIEDEYSWVDPAVYKVKRKEVLEGFLNRPSIFSTPYFVDEYEARARLNLTTAVDEL